MPVRPTRWSKERARLTASWPVSASATSSTSCGLAVGFDRGRLRHHLFVERGAAGGVEQHDVVAAELAGFERTARDLRRLLAGDDRQGRNVEIAAEHRELFHRRRAVDVERGHQHLALVALDQAAGELGGGGGFAGALQADHHDRDRRHGVEIDGLAVGAERRDQLVMDDLDHHLAGRDRLDDGGADRLLAHALGEAAHHLERDVGLEQRAAHLAHRRVDVGLATASRGPSADRECHQAFPTDCRTMPLSFVLLAQGCVIHRCHAPRKRGIQYAAASRFKPSRLWDTGSPAFAGDDTLTCVSPRDSAMRGDDVIPNTFAPEGASRCRALTSGLLDRSAGRKETLSDERAGLNTRQRPKSRKLAEKARLSQPGSGRPHLAQICRFEANSIHETHPPSCLGVLAGSAAAIGLPSDLVCPA